MKYPWEGDSGPRHLSVTHTLGTQDHQLVSEGDLYPLLQKQLCVLFLVTTLSKTHPWRDKKSNFPWVKHFLQIFREIKVCYDIHHSWERRVDKSARPYGLLRSTTSSALNYFDPSLKTNVGSGMSRLEKHSIISPQLLSKLKEAQGVVWLTQQVTGKIMQNVKFRT